MDFLASKACLSYWFISNGPRRMFGLTKFEIIWCFTISIQRVVHNAETTSQREGKLDFFRQVLEKAPRANQSALSE